MAHTYIDVHCLTHVLCPDNWVNSLVAFVFCEEDDVLCLIAILEKGGVQLQSIFVSFMHKR